MSRLPRTQTDTDSLLREIFRLLDAENGIDFGHYKQATVRRRIARRMALCQIECLPDYLHRLRGSREELEALYEDLLITVTSFFRDPEVFDCLQTRIIPKILAHVPADTPARVWVPGCASGEEVYSIAICFVEAAPHRDSPVQIFGTDVSLQCITRARHGLYSVKIEESVPPAKLRRFFVKEAEGYRISKVIRQMCIFAEQDVISDAPFSKMDLVSCRNLLMYLDTETQKQVLGRLYYALKTTGFLVLGTSESTAAAPQLFEQVEKPKRIYFKIPMAKPMHFAPATGLYGT